MSAKIPLIRAAAVVVALCSVPAGVLAGPPKRVQFAKGRTTTVEKGTVVALETNDYVLGARAGQQMILHLASPNSYANFIIYSVNGHSFEGMTAEDRDWSGELPESGDYVVRVFKLRSGRKSGRAPYTLEITIR
jgi:hypothetical protein